MTQPAEIDAVVAAHQFRSTSTTSRSGVNTHHAGCSCEAVKFDWYEREAQHRAHLLAEVFAAGQASVVPPVEHHPKCYQNTGVPDDLPPGLCDCKVLRMLDAEGVILPASTAQPTEEPK